MSEGEELKFPHRSVFDGAASTVSNGLEPLADTSNQLAGLGISEALVGMWPTGIELAAAIGMALEVAAVQHENHAKNVQAAVDKISQSGKLYHASEADNSAIVSDLKSNISNA
ncbi:hypothetical protein [Actinoallomurus iriomotensis]|uniref:Uncharacterized protein n=1 Tax=Actinoallomurus iriomotensis TaxID=478107 RepID=A0A9W6RY71_9ACTN|nr:hypothetical protein [Actinoallomurus iriomotensis]GLY83911.1 hypothetical protein Airi02_018400 [Actinoallomurus iriomotensis]